MISVSEADGGAARERVLLSRQPIYRADRTILGYELLFRNGDTDTAKFSDASQATAQVIVNAWEIGMDEMVGRHLAFMNFDRAFLMGKYCESLSHERVVLEILETVEPDAALMKRLKQLRSKGYRIALDDFVCSEPYSPLLQFADFVKLDVLASDWKEIERTLSVIRNYHAEVIAEKVETHEQVERCKAAGFRHFQGYFFCRPENVSRKALPANRLATVRLLTQLNKSEIKIEELEQTISQDLSLSYKLLRYINSALCSLDRHVESIRHAIVMVGLEKMRVWASLVVFSGFEESTLEVVVAGAVRARMCELLAGALKMPHPERCFLVGLFSVLDVILNRPMEQIVSMLSLSDEVNDALLFRKGELGAVLRCVQAYERRDWADAEASVDLIRQMIERSYQDALAWSFNMVKGLSQQPADAPKHP